MSDNIMVLCPMCEGEGIDENGRICSRCNGTGRVEGMNSRKKIDDIYDEVFNMRTKPRGRY